MVGSLFCHAPVNIHMTLSLRQYRTFTRTSYCFCCTDGVQLKNFFNYCFTSQWAGHRDNDSAYCERCYCSVVCPSVCLSVHMSHSCTLLTLLDRNEMPFGRDIRVVTLLLTGAPVTLSAWHTVPRWKGEVWGSDWGSKPPVKICIANCGQTVTESGILTIDSDALSNGISDFIRLSLPPNNMFAATPPSHFG